MRLFARTHNAAPVLALAAALAFYACDNSSNNNWTQNLPIVTLPDQKITVEAGKSEVTLTKVKGKTIYMARTNPNNEKLKGANSRTATLVSGFNKSVSASASKSSQANLDSVAARLTAGFEFSGANDPHKKIYDDFLKELEEAKGRAISKSAAPSIQAAARNYAVGDTETFLVTDPENTGSQESKYISQQFKLLISEDKYNIWVHDSDKNYTADTNAFTEAAQKLGTNFINGYELVSHLYGQPADKIYNMDGSVYGDMDSVSRTGTKINITLYACMGNIGMAGYVKPIDIFNADTSNKGRFVYIDSSLPMQKPLDAYSTAQHEFSHSITFNQKYFKCGRQWTYWYGELLAMLCEDMMQAYWGISDSEVDGNLAATPKSRLALANFVAWNNGISGTNIWTYAAAFQFGAWLSRSFGGAKFIKELAQNAYLDMESVINAVNAMGGPQYTQESLLQKFAEDMLRPEAGKGFFQDAATYPGNDQYTCAYTDANGQQQIYVYPITAINLWDPFYAWHDASGNYKQFLANQTVPFSSLPAANIYKTDLAQSGLEPPATAFLGPFLFNNGSYKFDIGPYGSMIFLLGTAASDSVTISFASDETPRDIITIFAK